MLPTMIHQICLVTWTESVSRGTRVKNFDLGSPLSFCYNNSLKELKNTMKKAWKLWAKALGEKALPANNDADKVALIRTIIVLSYFITNCFIVAGVIRHW